MVPTSKPEAEVAPRARRTRLTPEREAELYAAVLAELVESGYDALTMEAVAARARSSKATLYRQWGSKSRLVAEAMRHNRPFSLDGLDTGSLAGDIHELAGRMGRAKQDHEVFRAVAAAAHRDPELGAALQEVTIGPVMDTLREMLERAAARGEIVADAPAAAYFPHMLLGAMFGRKLFDRCEPDPEFLRRYVDDAVLPALRHRG
ncbi:TetR family transcriptional regulator [Mangrovactinospora gilvigrisea]|uniref:TetR family transcriptional regulator n=1 Tax=Mangrovactinospora gilvigrisea TaxID=1428644 RepID=A0A1J7BTH1_9ACTN|nr:TetR/AcrR family transcriptional regulator [Mangrovactinospora gilvigrisea]OIV36753.1 TetR family transcriptional regulator [Mangrovactinospora gilvigrisea]